jgi:FMN phosphatase YigB (HAD superfamily)
MIQAVVFDFGGVLTDSGRHRQRLQSYDALLGWPPGTLRTRLYSGPAWELASVGAISPDEHWEQVGADLESRLPPDFRRFGGNPFYLDQISRPVLLEAQRLARSHRLALCSNALPGLAGLLRALPQVEALFDPVVISALVGLRKPDPQILQLTATRLGLPLSACLLVDDKERNVRAAEDAGMPALLFRGAAQLEEDLNTRLGEGDRRM